MYFSTNGAGSDPQSYRTLTSDRSNATAQINNPCEGYNKENIFPQSTKVRYEPLVKNQDLDYTFRPNPEVNEMRKLKDRVTQLHSSLQSQFSTVEKAYEQSSRIWKKCETACNAYLSTSQLDSDEEIPQFSSIMHVKGKQGKKNKKGAIKRPNS